MKRVAIFGATSAIAAEFARRCAARGDSLFLVGRDAAKLNALVAVLGNSVRGSICADLDRTEHSADHVRAAIDALGRIELALIAHGWLGDQLATERDFAEAERVLHTNFSSAVSLIVPLANALESQGSGALAVITSVAGDRGRPRNYTYGAAKGALNLYLQGVRSRLWPRGIRVYAIRLGPVNTPMTEAHPKNALFSEPNVIAAQLIRALEGRRQDLYLPWYWELIMGVVRHVPEPIFQKLGFLSGR